MIKNKDKVVALTLATIAGLSSFGIMSGCEQKTPEGPTNTPGPVVNPTPTPSESKISVATVVNEYFANRNFRNEFNSSLISVASKKVNASDIKSVSLVSFNNGKSGKIVLNVQYKDSLQQPDQELTYSGDTTKFSNFYNLSINKDAVINSVLANNNLTLASEIVKNSTAHTKLKSDFANVISTYNSEKALFEGISASDITMKENTTPVEYVSVQNLVDEVFGGINFEANLKETMEKLVATRAPLFEVKKLFAFDFQVKESGEVKFYVEYANKSTQASYISSFAVTMNTTKISNYLSLSKDFDSAISQKLASQSLTNQSKIIKNSVEQQTLVETLNKLKQDYLAEKTSLDNTAKANIKTSVLLTPAQFNSTKMQELGISSMNDFAKALLNNTKGKDFDKVTGWGMNDVIATYVAQPTEENIEGKSNFDILIFHKEKIAKYNVETQRVYGDQRYTDCSSCIHARTYTQRCCDNT